MPASVGIVIGSGIAGKLINTVGPRTLVAAMTGGMLLGLLLLTRITVTSGALQIDATLVLVGLGAGLGLPALTDTVMAAVPEDEAGVGSAVNDVSRQLGGALGVAVIGSIVSSAYRSHLRGTQPAGINQTVARAAQQSIGVATQTAKSLPQPAAGQLLNAANTAYVNAITHGFYVSAVAMVAAFVVALDALAAPDACESSRIPARRRPKGVTRTRDFRAERHTRRRSRDARDASVFGGTGRKRGRWRLLHRSGLDPASPSSSGLV